MISATYQVTGMTCEHCTRAVTEELTALAGVTGVTVDLVPGGTSAAAMAFSSVFVVGNSLRLRRWRPRAGR